MINSRDLDNTVFDITCVFLSFALVANNAVLPFCDPIKNVSFFFFFPHQWCYVPPIQIAGPKKALSSQKKGQKVYICGDDKHEPISISQCVYVPLLFIIVTITDQARLFLVRKKRGE